MHDEPKQPPDIEPLRASSPCGVSAVIVTYQPDEGTLSNALAVLDQVDSLILVDNGSESDRIIPIVTALTNASTCIEVIRNMSNEGLAFAQNQGIACALQKGAGWILLLDQDSRPDAGMVAALLAAYRAAPHPERIGILAACPYEASQTLPSCFVIAAERGTTFSVKGISGQGVLENLLFCIASGSLIPARIIQELGGMRNDFFMDYIDIEFALRVRRAGYQILAVEAAKFLHRLGAYEERRLLTWTIGVTHHSAERRYLQYRNRVRTLRLYSRQFPALVRYELRAFLIDLIRLFCFEQHRWAKLCSIFRGMLKGITEGRQTKLGPLPRMDKKTFLDSV